MELFLVFDPAGKCVGEIGGAAIVSDGMTAIQRPPETSGVPFRRLTYDGTAVKVASITPEESAAAEAEAFQNALLRGMAKVLFNHENRIRALESKPAITMEQFKAAIKSILGL